MTLAAVQSTDRCGTVQLATRACFAVADALVLFATWRVTRKTLALNRSANVKVNITDLLIRDGEAPLHILVRFFRSSAMNQAVSTSGGNKCTGHNVYSILIAFSVLLLLNVINAVLWVTDVRPHDCHQAPHEANC